MTERPDIVPEAHEVMRLVDQIKPLFANRDPNVVGAVLADLLAVLLAGHVADTPAKTRVVRERVLAIHLKAVKALIPLNENMIKEKLQKAQDNAKDRPN